MPYRGRFIAAITVAAALCTAEREIARGQGMAAHGAVARPRPKASGRVFPVSFVDVAAAAGLTAPLVSGGERKQYILESMGAGAAFLDYDNDGWPDLFLVNGSR